MKYILIAFVLALPVFAAAAAPVANDQPLLLHAYDEGLVPPFMHHRGHCAIYENRIVILRNYNGVESQEIRPLVLKNVDKLKELIKKSSAGKISTKAMPTDLPYDGYTAYVDPNAPSVILKVSQSTLASENESEAARSLLLLIDAHCPDIRR